MAIDTASPRSRRALLSAALGAGAATVAAAIRPLSTDADSGDPWILGANNEADNGTTLRNTSYKGEYVSFLLQDYGVSARSQSPFGAGVIGDNISSNGIGVYGSMMSASQSSAIGVVGETAGHYSQIGVRGISDPEGIGVHGVTANGIGVRGEAPGGWGVHGVTVGNRGVFGEATTGYGVRGGATSGAGVSGVATSGIGVSAESETGYAIRSFGRVRFDKCVGVATIASGTKSVVVSPGIDLTSSSAVVATLQASAGGTTTVHRCVVHTTSNTFTIYLTANAVSATKVAWHVFG